MKTQKLVLGIMISFLIVSCSKDEVVDSNKALTATEAKVDTEIDGIADDVSTVIDDQFEIQRAISGRPSGEEARSGFDNAVQTHLPSCVTITTVVTATTWTRTVDFGTVGCQMPNGNILKGKIIISGSIHFNQSSHIISYTFLNFYHNNKLIQGNKTVVRTMIETNAVPYAHPLVNMSLNLSVTYPNGNVHTRVGVRTREFIGGFLTPLVSHDNVFSVTGNWTTTSPNGTHTTTIIIPLIVKMSCPHIVKGAIQMVRNNNTAVLDYGNGECDNQATLTINGITTTITLGN